MASVLKNDMLIANYNINNMQEEKESAGVLPELLPLSSLEFHNSPLDWLHQFQICNFKLNSLLRQILELRTCENGAN